MTKLAALFRADDGIRPGAVWVWRPRPAGGGVEPHLTQASARFRLHVQPLMAPEAGAVECLVRDPGFGIDNAPRPAIFNEEIGGRMGVRSSAYFRASRTLRCQQLGRGDFHD